VETEYWRASFNKVVNSTGGSAQVQAARKKLKDMIPDLKSKLANKGLSPTHDGEGYSTNEIGVKDLVAAIGHSMNNAEEAKFWKDLAHETWGQEKVDQWVADGRHMPQYQKMDLTSPDLSHGTANFERIDAFEDVDALKKKGVLLAIGNNGKDKSLNLQIDSGGMISTESRLRILGRFKKGASSSADQTSGGGDEIFTRLAIPGEGAEFTGSIYGSHVSYWSPDAMRYTDTYSFNGDNFGRKSYQVSGSPYDVKSTLNFGNAGNETMIPETLSIFDFLEIMVFDTQAGRQEAIDKMKKLGFDMLRGVPIEERFVMRADLKKALAKVRAQWM
jgi:hypothetical protein